MNARVIYRQLRRGAFRTVFGQRTFVTLELPRSAFVPVPQWPERFGAPCEPRSLCLAFKTEEGLISELHSFSVCVSEGIDLLEGRVEVSREPCSWEEGLDEVHGAYIDAYQEQPDGAWKPLTAEESPWTPEDVRELAQVYLNRLAWEADVVWASPAGEALERVLPYVKSHWAALTDDGERVQMGFSLKSRYTNRLRRFSCAFRTGLKNLKRQGIPYRGPYYM